MKNYQYVLDIETPFIRKLYDKEDNYKVELLTPYGILEELKKLQEENADLEAKLAESDENIKLLEQDRVVICNTMDMYREKVEKLKQQLAEKETEIKSLSSEISSLEQDLTHYKGEVYNLKDQLAEEETRIAELEKILEDTTWTLNDKLNEIGKADQDKISFAVEQLEKVKEWCENHKYSDEDDYVITYEPDEEDASGCIDYLKEYIDNQIEELKKEMK